MRETPVTINDKPPVRNTTVPINVEGDIVVARSATRDVARQLGFGAADQTRIATAISELARNVIKYAGAGACVITDVSNRSIAGLRVVIEDHGPGIDDLGKAMEDGFSASDGLGVGLPGAKRLVHEFFIESNPGQTTIVVAIFRRR